MPIGGLHRRIGAITVGIGAAAALLIPALKSATATALKPVLEGAS